MRETPDIETSSDDYASRFAGAAGRYFLDVQSSTVKRALDGISKGLAVELGGGHGQLISLLEEAGYDIVECGSDASCHDMLVERHPDSVMHPVTGDMCNLPFSDQSADMVIYVRLISHIENWPELIAESCRVSKQAVIFDYPSLVSANALTPFIFGLKKGIEKNTRTYISFNKKQLKIELEKHGFVISRHISQFMLPMFLHRALKGSKLLQYVEHFFRLTGLTHLFGSPVILRADRIVDSK
jgi:ubiquinone/menaquinone biosynthesis C-methylase UbiE